MKVSKGAKIRNQYNPFPMKFGEIPPSGRDVV